MRNPPTDIEGVSKLPRLYLAFGSEHWVAQKKGAIDTPNAAGLSGPPLDQLDNALCSAGTGSVQKHLGQGVVGVGMALRVKSNMAAYWVTLWKILQD
jgi:hypothetical protein